MITKYPPQKNTTRSTLVTDRFTEKSRNGNSLEKRLRSIGNFIGRTPLYPFTSLSENKNVKIYGKLEWKQLGGSVKARPAFQIIKSAIENGALGSEKTLLDASSGNTAIAYASIGAQLGIRVTICLPENASEERKAILQSLGAEIVYTSALESTDGAQDVALEMYKNDPERFFYADQYRNNNNWKAHYEGTAREIYSQTSFKVTHFVAGLGTTGTFMGTGKRLKELNEDIQLIALQPDAALHGLEGWKHLETAKVPSFYSASLADQINTVSTEGAFEVIKKVAKEENLLISPSAAANLYGAIELSKKIDHGIIVTVLPDNAEKYKEVIRYLFSS